MFEELMLLMKRNIFVIINAHIVIKNIKLIMKLSFLCDIITNIWKINKAHIYIICNTKINLLLINNLSLL